MTITHNDLLDRELIREVIYKYCKAVDQLDWELLFQCFTDDAKHEHGPFSGNNESFKEIVETVISGADGTHHTIGTILIELDGDKAKTESSFVAYHRFPGGPDGSAPVPTNGVDTDWILAGRYIDDFVKTQDGWKISYRRAPQDWMSIAKAHPKLQ